MLPLRYSAEENGNVTSWGISYINAQKVVLVKRESHNRGIQNVNVLIRKRFSINSLCGVFVL
jgi:hypothetical protein